jgi:uncharacterized protein
MPANPLDYSQLVERALRRVVHDALEVVALQGLPGRHHLYITFRTDHPGVVLDDSLRARYPAEMTVVLQHEFWGLEVAPDRFGVTLSFGGQPQRVEVPFAAIRVFADPSVEFGLQFTGPDGAGEGAGSGAGTDKRSEPPAGAAKPRAVSAATPPAEPSEAEGAEVVTLDRFRKK